MVAKAKFEPIGEFLSVETAFSQAAMALDVAGAIAQQRQDVEGLSNVAALYIELGARLMGPAEEDEDHVDHEALEKKQPIGYRPCPPPIVPVEEVELEDE